MQATVTLKIKPDEYEIVKAALEFYSETLHHMINPAHESKRIGLPDSDARKIMLRTAKILQELKQ